MSHVPLSPTQVLYCTPPVGTRSILLAICFPLGLLQSQVTDPPPGDIDSARSFPNEFPAHYPLWKEMMEKINLGYVAPASSLVAASLDSDGDGISDLQEAHQFTDPKAPNRRLTVDELVKQREYEAQQAQAASVSRTARQASARAFAAQWLGQPVESLEPGNDLSPEGLRQEKRRRLAQALPMMLAESEADVRDAKAAAQRLGWPLKFNGSGGGGGGVLKGTVVNGVPEYLTTQNIQAAQTILVDKLWPILPATPPFPPDPLNLHLSLEGGFLRHPGTSSEEIVPAVRMGLWEPGRPVTTHSAFGRFSFGSPTTANSRVTDKETVPETDPILSHIEHATHVSGTLAGRGLDNATNSVLDPQSQTRGMAPFAEVHSRDTDFAVSEMAKIFTEEPETNRFFVSNHSYITSPGWTGDYRIGPYPAGLPPMGNFPIWSTDVLLSGGEEDYRFGFYSPSEQAVDALVYASETYLPVWAAGNERKEMDQGVPSNYYHWEVYSGTTPDPGLRPQDYDFSDGYDTLPPEPTAKNVLTVTSVPDRQGGISAPDQVESSYFASWGSPDYGHIKPDVAANGEDLLSALPDGTYDFKSGTSMAAPNVTGFAALLVELLQRQYGITYEPPAALLKALIIAGTDDIAPVGPDYKTGWGLVNARKSAEIVALNAASGGQHIRIVQVQNGVTGSFTVKQGCPRSRKDQAAQFAGARSTL